MNFATPPILCHVLLLLFILQITPTVTESPHIMLLLSSLIALALLLWVCSVVLGFALFTLLAFVTMVFIRLMTSMLLLLVLVSMLRGLMLMPVVRNRGHRIGLLILLRFIKQRIQNLGSLQLG